jgi:hypothetical protein
MKDEIANNTLLNALHTSYGTFRPSFLIAAQSSVARSRLIVSQKEVLSMMMPEHI